TRFSRDWSSDVCSSDLFKNSTGFKFSVSPSFNYSFSRRKVIVNSVVSDAKSQNGGPNLGFTFDWNSKVEFRPSYRYHISSTKYRSEERRVGKECISRSE